MRFTMWAFPSSIFNTKVIYGFTSSSDDSFFLTNVPPRERILSIKYGR